jgi:hypothetical protein
VVVNTIKFKIESGVYRHKVDQTKKRHIFNVENLSEAKRKNYERLPAKIP